jgi:DNA-binding CsgD family transcriptional regulator
MDFFPELLKAVTDYIAERRNFESRGIYNTSRAENLVKAFKTNLQKLADELNWEIPDTIYAKNLIGFGVQGVNDPVYRLIWEQYYLSGKSIASVSKLTHYSVRNTKRLIQKLPVIVAEQLVEKNLEIDNRDYVDPSTIKQRKETMIIDNLGLTKRQAEILLLLSETGQHLGQKILCEKLRLTESGLKKHIRAIIRKLGVPNRREAVKKALVIIGEPEPE